jgi:2-amino-4-hydroxy-6-hydroxymethyldihydropteridine diphosphokinase
MIRKIIFCLGSNVGNRESYLKLANEHLENRLNLKHIKTSSILQNKALLLENSPKEWDVDFYNIAISANINLDKFPPLEILNIVKEIEINIGRRDRGRWAPREIDIDIAAIDDIRIKEDVLEIPHRGIFQRDFFLKTISEIEPEILEKLRNV